MGFEPTRFISRDGQFVWASSVRARGVYILRLVLVAHHAWSEIVATIGAAVLTLFRHMKFSGNIPSQLPRTDAPTTPQSPYSLDLAGNFHAQNPSRRKSSFFLTAASIPAFTAAPHSTEVVPNSRQSAISQPI